MKGGGEGQVEAGLLLLLLLLQLLLLLLLLSVARQFDEAVGIDTDGVCVSALCASCCCCCCCRDSLYRRES
jgi:hypothetical protein